MLHQKIGCVKRPPKKILVGFDAARVMDKKIVARYNLSGSFLIGVIALNAIYLDCFAGISGNMFLGACIQLGVPVAHLIAELEKLPFDDHYHIVVDDVSKNGIAAVHLDVDLHDHHDHHEHHHRSMADIRSIIERSTLDLEIKKLSLLIFEKLAAAEGKVHNKPSDEVHFHEVGAVDSIIDIVGAAICIDYLNIERAFVSKINVGSGTVRCAHGLMPVPAPATAELLAEFPTYRSTIERELTTPTGAAIVASLAEYSFDLPESFSVERIGYGAGTYDLEIPNVLRIYYGASDGRKARKFFKLETNIDDMNPQIYGYLYERLLKAGALDVWTTPIYMKKNRPAQTLTVLVDDEHQSECTKIIFEETTTLGLRVMAVDERIECERRQAKIETTYGEVTCKVSAFDGKIVSITPEYEDCRRLASEKNVPLKNIWLEALSKQNDRINF